MQNYSFGRSENMGETVKTVKTVTLKGIFSEENYYPLIFNTIREQR